MSERTLTRGARALARILIERDMAQIDLTKLLGCADGLVSRWLSGERVPMARFAAQLEAQLEIPARWWGEDAPIEEPPPSARRPSVPVPKASEPSSPELAAGPHGTAKMRAAPPIKATG